MFLHHYAAVTAENAMKVDAISGGSLQATRPANLLLGGARTMVNFAEQHGLYMVGHTLVWHEQSAPWLYRHGLTGEYLTREEAKENLRWFIEQYAGYFDGRIHAWDVTNEVFTNGGGANREIDGPEGSPVYPVGSWQRALRNNVPWYHVFANGADFEAGERAYDYIYYAFVFARRYAPSALLIYNDFNEEAPHKRNAMANMTIELNERWHADSVNNPAYGNPNHPDYGRLLIEVIGMQAHYNHSTNLENVRLALELFASTGARIHVTELDIHFNQVVPAPFTMTEAQMNRQADMFAQLFIWYKEFSDYIDRVSIWGREDGSSWRGAGAATHFDRFFRPKPAFWAMVDPVGWLERER
jgi:GH35 family endo-1,4-beta-xylanase